LGLKTDNFLTWKDNIDELVIKINRSCFAIRSVKSILPLETLRTVYYSYVHAILNYGIIFWGNSSHSIRVSRIQKWIIRIMTTSAKRVPCHSLFRELSTLPLQSQYILSTCMFIITNREVFKFNSQVHKFNTRSTHDSYYHQDNLTQLQKRICYMGVKIFDHLPSEIKSMPNDRKSFKSKLTTFLL
jgi:predicted membrane protein